MSSDAGSMADSIQRGNERLRAVLLGRVLSYDAARQSCSVQPIPRHPDGRLLPRVDNVPVVFPTAGFAAITLPVAVGDTVLLLAADWAIDQWLTSGSEASPADKRTHDLNDFIAVPGLTHYGAPRQNAADDKLRVTVDGAVVVEVGADGIVHLGGNVATQALAIAASVSTALDSLKSAISGAAVVTGDGGAAFKSAIVASLAAWPPSVATTKVKGL